MEKEVSIAKTFDLIQINEISKTISYKELLKAVRGIILNSASAFKFSEKMSLNTATTLAADLIEKFKYESIGDVVLMLKMARQGELGKTDGRIDADILSTVLIPNYLLHKAEVREKNYHKQKFAKPIDKEELKPIAPKYLKKLEELQRKFSTKPEETNTPAINHHHLFISRLKEAVKIMPLDRLKLRAKEFEGHGNDTFKEAIKIIQNEIENRNQ